MSSAKINPISLGETIPDVTLQNVQGEKINLHKLASEKPTLIIFYRGGWCPYCNVHLADLGKIEADLVALGIQIMAISPDKLDYLKGSEAKHELNYMLLSDSKMEAAKAFGLAYEVDEATLNALAGYQIDLKEKSGQDHEMLPVPAAILVQTDLTVSYVFANEDYTVRVNNIVLVEEIQRALNSEFVAV